MSTNLKRRLVSRAVSQFGRPRGLPGHAVGWFMSTRRSNRRRNQWAVALLDVQPGDRILEIGFGPGIAIRELATRATQGTVYGVDHSAVMVRQATRRNARAVKAGRVRLTLGSVTDLPTFQEPLDVILAVNSLLFWPDPPARLKELASLLRPGGTIAIAHQPRCPGANRATSTEAASEIAGLLARTGVRDLQTEMLDLDPPVVCVLARKA